MEINKFKEILNMSQEEVIDFMRKFLSSRGYVIEGLGEEGLVARYPEVDKNIAVIAHADTINTHRYVYDGTKYEMETEILDEKYIKLSDNDIKNGYKCLGADDRAGIMTIVDVVNSGLRPHVIIPTDEEIGCVGSSRLAFSMKFSDSVYFLLQIDRGNHGGSFNEYVTYDCDIPDIIRDELDTYFTESNGSFSDVAVLAPSLNVPGVNVSASYINEHTVDEKLNIEAYNNNLRAIKKFIADFDYTAKHYYMHEDDADSYEFWF